MEVAESNPIYYLGAMAVAYSRNMLEIQNWSFKLFLEGSFVVTFAMNWQSMFKWEAPPGGRSLAFGTTTDGVFFVISYKV
jgi:hypothetical protein